MSYANVWDAREYTPGADGAPDIRVESVLEDASRYVRGIAPPPPANKKLALREAIDADDTTMLVGTSSSQDPLILRHVLYDIFDFPSAGVLEVDSEKIAYDNVDPDNLSFVNLTRGYDNTIAAPHLQFATVTDVTYPYVARNAELRVFDYLWMTGGISRQVSSPIGASTSYEGQGFIKSIITQVMGAYALTSKPVNIT